MAEHDISSVHHIPIGKLICYARAAIAFEECVRHGGNVEECIRRFREAIAHCGAPDAAAAGGATSGGGSASGGSAGGGSASGGSTGGGSAGGGSAGGGAAGGGGGAPANS